MTCCFLPHRQLRNSAVPASSHIARFLPHRQLRKPGHARSSGSAGFLPHRQLRKAVFHP